MHMIGISGRCVAEPNAPPAASTLPLRTPAHVEGARPSPSAKRDANSAEPKILGGSFHYAMGVFNFCLGASVGLRRTEPRADRFSWRLVSHCIGMDPGKSCRR